MKGNSYKNGSVLETAQTDFMLNVVDENIGDAEVSTIRNCYRNPVETSRPDGKLDDVESGSGSKHQIEKMEKIMRRLQRSMALFGLYSVQNTEENNGHQKLTNKLHKLLRWKQTLYQMIILIFFLFFIGRTILSFFIGENLSKFTPLRLAVVFWMVQCTLSMAVLVKASHKRFGSQLKACQWCFSNVLPLFKELDVCRSTQSVRRLLLLTIFIGWLFIAINIAVISFFVIFEDNSFHKVLVSILLDPIPVNIVTKSVVIIFNAYATVAWMLSMIYAITLNLILRYSFKLSREALFNAISKKENKTEFPRCLYKQRVLHLNISKLVTLLNNDFNIMFANWFATNIPTGCLLLYQLIKDPDMDTVILVSYIFWFLANILPISITATVAASTHDAAHSLVDHIYDVGTKDISLEQMGQLTLFLSKLNGSPIGFTVLNLITITKELLLTIGGLYLTYFFVLWQF